MGASESGDFWATWGYNVSPLADVSRAADRYGFALKIISAAGSCVSSDP